MSDDAVQNVRIDRLEEQVNSHSDTLKELSTNVATLGMQIETTNTLLREGFTTIKKAGIAISGLIIAAAGSAGVML